MGEVTVSRFEDFNVATDFEELLGGLNATVGTIEWN
jgi:hypothetical protein